MSQLDETIEEYAIDPGSGVLIPERDLVIREQIFEYAITKADTDFHRAISHLYGHWDTINAEYFDGVLIPPVILLAEPGSTTSYGDCSSVSGFGGSTQIRIRPSILDGTLQALAHGSKDPAGLMRFAEHVLLHETIHQWALECLPREAVIAESKNYNGHGPIFSTKANEIGKKLGYPTVRQTNRSRGKDGHLPSPSQWPHSVCPCEYYLGAYVPTSSDKEAKLREHLSLVLRQHGIEKVERVTREIWQQLEEARKEQGG